MVTKDDKDRSLDTLVETLGRSLDSNRITKSYLQDRPNGQELARHSLDAVVRGAFRVSFPKAITYEYGYKGYSPQVEKMWIIEREYCNAVETSDALQMATVRLHPGVSVREAQKAAALAVASFGKKSRTGRPPISDWNRRFLWELFSVCEKALYRRGGRKQVIELAHEIFKKLGHKTSLTKVGNELGRFLREKGHPVKHYIRS